MMISVIRALQHYNDNFATNFTRETLEAASGEASSVLVLFNEIEVKSAVLKEFSLDSQTLDWMRRDLLLPIKNFYDSVLKERQSQFNSFNTLELWTASYSEAKNLLPNIEERYPNELVRSYMLLLSVVAETCFFRA